MIVVCGEALIDIIHNGDGTQRHVPGGGPFNTARALARLGVPTAFLGRLSLDAFGRELAGLLDSDGVSLELASFGPEPTTTAIATVNDDGLTEYEFVLAGTSAPSLNAEMLPVQLGHEVDGLHVGTLGLVVEPMASALAGLVRRDGDGRLVMLDPNIRRGLAVEASYRERLTDVISRSAIVKASQEDLAWLYPDIDYEHAAEKLIAEGPRLAVVTLGLEGAFGLHGGLRVHVASPRVEVVDTIGAGDTFGAALLAWLHDHARLTPDFVLEHDELRAALDYACLAAAIICTRAGAEPPWKSEMGVDTLSPAPDSKS